MEYPVVIAGAVLAVRRRRQLARPRRAFDAGRPNSPMESTAGRSTVSLIDVSADLPENRIPAVGLLRVSDESPILDISCRYCSEFAGDMTMTTTDPKRRSPQAGTGELHVGFDESSITDVIARGNRLVPELALTVCDRIGVRSQDLDLLVTNQPNRVFCGSGASPWDCRSSGSMTPSTSAATSSASVFQSTSTARSTRAKSRRATP